MLPTQAGNGDRLADKVKLSEFMFQLGQHDLNSVDWAIKLQTNKSYKRFLIFIHKNVVGSH